MISGDRVADRIGWNRLPEKTVVLLNQEKSSQLDKNQGPIKTISDGLTAWSFAGPAYRAETSFCFFPNRQMKNSRQVSYIRGFFRAEKMIYP